MKIVIQRVRHASVTIENEISGTIEKGLVLLVGFAAGDSRDILPAAAKKVCALRIFEDESGKMNRSVRESNGSLLVVPNFTLAGSLEKGNRPSFDTALVPERARLLFDWFIEELRKHEIPLATGTFGATMQVSIENDGPVTFVYDTNHHK